MPTGVENNMFIPLGLCKAPTITQSNLSLGDLVQQELSLPISFHSGAETAPFVERGHWFSVTCYIYLRWK